MATLWRSPDLASISADMVFLKRFGFHLRMMRARTLRIQPLGKRSQVRQVEIRLGAQQPRPRMLAAVDPGSAQAGIACADYVQFRIVADMQNVFRRYAEQFGGGVENALVRLRHAGIARADVESEMC